MDRISATLTEGQWTIVLDTLIDKNNSEINQIVNDIYEQLQGETI